MPITRTVQPASLVGRPVVLPRADGKYDVGVIRNIEHVITAGTKEEADRVSKLLTTVATVPTKPATPPAKPTSASKGTPGRKAAARKVGRQRKGAGGKKVTHRARAAGTPPKEGVDVEALAAAVEDAVS